MSTKDLEAFDFKNLKFADKVHFILREKHVNKICLRNDMKLKNLERKSFKNEYTISLDKTCS